MNTTTTTKWPINSRLRPKQISDPSAGPANYVTTYKSCELHALAGKNEALEWGRFRSGLVTIAGTDYMPPKAEEFPGLFESLEQDLKHIADVYDQSIHVFLSMARNQFFYDVNKRMGRFMMNGLLLSEGFPAINLPAKRQLEFNSLMIDF